MARQPLTGHSSQSSAHVTPDYPYSFRLRCQRLAWLEHKPGKGFRLVTQTSNPKRTGTWNKPKASTYIDFAAALYLDTDGHVQWCGVGPYTSAQEALGFVSDFGEGYPGGCLRAWAKRKAAFCDAMATGRARFEINGKPCEETEHDRAQHAAERDVWLAVVAKLAEVKP
jgi:hypothetical protein